MATYFMLRLKYLFLAALLCLFILQHLAPTLEMDQCVVSCRDEASNDLFNLILYVQVNKFSVMFVLNKV